MPIYSFKYLCFCQIRVIRLATAAQKTVYLQHYLIKHHITASLYCLRFILDDFNNRFYLHGLNIVYSKDMAGQNRCHWKHYIYPCWFYASFEYSAFILAHDGETDLHEIWDEPLPAVISTLSPYTDYEIVLRNLPGI
jgi:hypothetical protein